MDDVIKQIIRDARLIIDNQHDGFGSSVVEEVYHLQQQAMWMAGWCGTKHDEDTWDEYIPQLPKEIQGVMIELDDALGIHDTTRYM